MLIYTYIYIYVITDEMYNMTVNNSRASCWNPRCSHLLQGAGDHVTALGCQHLRTPLQQAGVSVNVGPCIEPKKQGSDCRDTHKKDPPQFMQTARFCTTTRASATSAPASPSADLSGWSELSSCSLQQRKVLEDPEKSPRRSSCSTGIRAEMPYMVSLRVQILNYQVCTHEHHHDSYILCMIVLWTLRVWFWGLWQASCPPGMGNLGGVLQVGALTTERLASAPRRYHMINP